MHTRLRAAALIVLLSFPGSPALVEAQRGGLEPVALDATTSRPFRDTPEWVERLEAQDLAPPCGAEGAWARSVLDGSLVSRRRPDTLPCRAVWDNPLRLELGLAAGGLLERSDGFIGGLSFALGLRYREYFSVYYQLHLLAGRWDVSGGWVADATAWNAVLLEVSPHEHFAFAMGPAIDILASCSDGVAQEPSSCAYAWSYGLAARITVPLAQVDDVGVALTADMHLTTLENESREQLGVTDGTRLVGLLGVGFRF